MTQMDIHFYAFIKILRKFGYIVDVSSAGDFKDKVTIATFALDDDVVINMKLMYIDASSVDIVVHGDHLPEERFNRMGGFTNMRDLLLRPDATNILKNVHYALSIIARGLPKWTVSQAYIPLIDYNGGHGAIIDWNIDRIVVIRYGFIGSTQFRLEWMITFDGRQRIRLIIGIDSRNDSIIKRRTMNRDGKEIMIDRYIDIDRSEITSWIDTIDAGNENEFVCRFLVSERDDLQQRVISDNERIAMNEREEWKMESELNSEELARMESCSR